MKIAVTGASGFVGRHILAELCRNSIDVVAITRDASRLRDWAKSVQIEIMDINQPPPHPYNRMGRPDMLIHLAWDGLPNYNSLHHFETELPRQYGFLKTMVKGGLPALLVTGTCFEYGMLSGPLTENLKTRPANPYGYAKDALRRQLELLHVVHSFVFTWGRMFYVYGKDQRQQSLYSQLQEAVSKGVGSFNMSGGEQLRDYLHVDEAARIIVQLAMRRCNAGTVNICSGTPISVRSLVERWVRENKWEIQLNLGFYPYPDYEPMAFWGDRRRLDFALENS